MNTFFNRKPRKKTRRVVIGSTALGGTEPVRIQSMCSTKTDDTASTIAQIKTLQTAGCEIIRVAVPDMRSVHALRAIKRAIRIPLVADIHFDHRLALGAIRQGVDKIRINPGNIGSESKMREIIIKAKEHSTAVRIGVNAGSLKILRAGGSWRNMGHACRAQQMVREALEHIALCEKLKFKQLVISLKSSDIETTMAAYRLMSRRCSYPLHIGITEAGSLVPGIVKSTFGIGGLLAEGIGDTIRVSLTDDPVYEVKAAREILRALTIRSWGPEIISCPTCARCDVNMTRTVHQLENAIDEMQAKKIKMRARKIAVMGCVVNGPGEAKDADIGIAGGKNTGLLFRNGKPVRKIPPGKWVSAIVKELKI